MKKIILSGISILFLTVLVISCNSENQETNKDLSSKIDAINQKYQKVNQSNARINGRKAGFMAVADVMSAALSPCLFGYGTLWGGFIGSCGAAVLYDDMTRHRITGNLNLVVPTIKKNPDDSFDKYSLAGKYHNDFMIQYCGNNSSNAVFTEDNKPSNYIKSEMLNSNHFDQSADVKQNFILTLNKFDNLFTMMNNADSEYNMINELKNINTNPDVQKEYLFKITDFTLNNALSPDEMFSYITEIENSMKSSNELDYASKENLFYNLEILRYSYALWNANIQD